jgi:hypothetical protein
MRYFTVISKDYWNKFVENLMQNSNITWNNRKALNKYNPFIGYDFQYNCLISYNTDEYGIMCFANVDSQEGTFLNIDEFIEKCGEIFPNKSEEESNSFECIIEKSLWKDFSELLENISFVKWRNGEAITKYNPLEDDLNFICLKYNMDYNKYPFIIVCKIDEIENLVSKVEFINKILKEEQLLCL